MEMRKTFGILVVATATWMIFLLLAYSTRTCRKQTLHTDFAWRFCKLMQGKQGLQSLKVEAEDAQPRLQRFKGTRRMESLYQKQAQNKLAFTVRNNSHSDQLHDSAREIYISDPSKASICHTFSPGRFGNHLFEYASILGIARKTNKTFFFSNDHVLGRFLKNPPVQTNHSQMKTRCKKAKTKHEVSCCRYDKSILALVQEPGKDFKVQEYLQSWLYFDGLVDEIRKALVFRDDIVQNATRFVNRIRTTYPNTTLIGIHNRRGDLTKTGPLRLGYLTAPPKFFHRAMTYFRERFSRVKFIVGGEDGKWNTENILPVNDDVIHLVNNSPVLDMQILSMTDHMIRTVGTFGWWAALKITGKPTVVYLKEFGTKSLRSWYSHTAEDYFLPGWIPM